MFAKRLKELRIDAGLKQSELARKLDISPSTIGMYEQGRRSADQETLLKISDLFDVSTDYLLGRTNVRNNLFISKNGRDYDAENFKTEKELIENMYLDEDMRKVFNVFSELSEDAREKALKVAELFLLDEKSKK
ncbi:helix-turn-helix transcriptional regulator [Clostridioides difficile]|nr:helix-turn-helix transcriptional regulator [Clostridioides difficile]